MKRALLLALLALAFAACSDSSSQPKQICEQQSYCKTRAFGGGCVEYATREVCKDIKY